MAIYPGAVWRPLPENETQPHITAVQAIWHSAVDAPGPTSLYGYFAQERVKLESHFFIKFDGTVEQYIDTARSADANYRANRFYRDGRPVGAISVETEDDGDPDRTPWTPEQLEASELLGLWIHETHGVPVVICPEWNADGFGYHTLFPQDWTPYRGKTCPGRVRIVQFRNDLLPRIERAITPVIPEPEGDEDEMPSPEQVEIDRIALVEELYVRYLGRRPSVGDTRRWVDQLRQRGAEAVHKSIAESGEAKRRDDRDLGESSA